ncbi:TPM domain-containing protein [Patescibacteria group bacterium]
MQSKLKFSKRGLVLISAFFSLLFWGGVKVQALDLPSPVGYVNDFASIFSGEFTTSLEQDLENFEKQTTNEIAIVTVSDLEGEAIEEYAVRLFESWKIGKKGEDNGLLLLIASSDRKLRIEVGYGLEPFINDARAGRIIRDQITPAFKEGDYEKGTAQAVAEIKKYLEGGFSQEEEILTVAGDQFSPYFFPVMILFVYLASFWGRSKRIWPGGLAGLVLGGFLAAKAGGFLWPVFLGFLGLFLDWLLSQNYQKLKTLGKSTNWWSSRGGFGGFGGKSSGGFGGFGGGSSGGGGASGSW